jgi:Pilus formation protein N terminal region
MSQGRLRQRWQLSIATLLWLTLCAASFFGGQYWDRMAKAIARRPLNRSGMQVMAGKTGRINSPFFPISRIEIDDPAIGTVRLVGPNEFEVKANNPGQTEITIWGSAPRQTTIWDITVVARH